MLIPILCLRCPCLCAPVLDLYAICVTLFICLSLVKPFVRNLYCCGAFWISASFWLLYTFGRISYGVSSGTSHVSNHWNPIQNDFVAPNKYEAMPFLDYMYVYKETNRRWICKKNSNKLHVADLNRLKCLSTLKEIQAKCHLSFSLFCLF